MAQAVPSILPASMEHKVQVEVGTGIATGNADYHNIIVGGKITSTTGQFKNELKGKFANVDQKNGDSENMYKANNKLKYEITPDDYAFGELEYVGNKPSGITRRTSESVGYGRNIVTKDNLNIAAEAAVGARQSDYKAGLSDESSYLGKVGTIIDWEIHDNININNDTYVALTNDNTQAVSDTSVKTYVYDDIYVKGAFNVENNNNTPAGVRKTDTVTSVNVGYEF